MVCDNFSLHAIEHSKSEATAPGSKGTSSTSAECLLSLLFTMLLQITTEIWGESPCQNWR